MRMADESKHDPVLVNEVISCLQPQGAGVYIDCTFGRGGYSQAIVEKIDHAGRVLALDTDPDAIKYGSRLFAKEPRLILRHSNYDKVGEIVAELNFKDQIKGVVFDLGVSSPQLDDASRGFSFRNDGPLDMRMNPEAGLNAQEWVNSAGLDEIRRVIRRFGEEYYADRIAKKMILARAEKSINTTSELAEIIYQAIPGKVRYKRKIHPATKVFQAIRIHINDELGHLERGLKAAAGLLHPDSALVVVSFHSLEDRIVKRYFRHLVEGAKIPDKLPLLDKQIGGDFEYISRLSRPSAEEISKNPRSRSAKLRAIRKFR